MNRTNNFYSKSLCENCLYSIDCKKLVPCDQYTPAISTAFEKDLVEDVIFDMQQS
jgi:hypothetical protein